MGGSGCCLSVCFVVFQVYTTPSVDVLVVVDLYEEIDRRFFFIERERQTRGTGDGSGFDVVFAM